MRLSMAELPSGSEEDVAKFWSFVLKTDSCWNWQGCRTKGGTWYGQVKFRPWRGRVAHRVAYHIANGPIPAGLHVLHNCDNPACCNPAHLRIGTQSENMFECYEKGRRTLPEGGYGAQARKSRVTSIPTP